MILHSICLIIRDRTYFIIYKDLSQSSGFLIVFILNYLNSHHSSSFTLINSHQLSSTLFNSIQLSTLSNYQPQLKWLPSPTNLKCTIFYTKRKIAKRKQKFLYTFL